MQASISNSSEPRLYPVHIFNKWVVISQGLDRQFPRIWSLTWLHASWCLRLVVTWSHFRFWSRLLVRRSNSRFSLNIVKCEQESSPTSQRVNNHPNGLLFQHPTGQSDSVKLHQTATWKLAAIAIIVTISFINDGRCCTLLRMTSVNSFLLKGT